MASVTLTELWLHDADNLSDNLALSVHAISSTPERNVEVRQYAGGRQRAIRTPQRPRSVSVELRFIDRADVDQLKAWLGELLLLRDPRGRKVYGVYAGLDVVERIRPEKADVSFTFREVTSSEEV